MKLLSRALSFGVLASAFLTSPSFAGDADFTLLNRTGYTLREIYISPTHRNSWGDDRLGKSYLDNGKSRLFRFSDKSSCKQDLKVVFDDDDSEVVWEEFDLCEINNVTLKYNRKSGMVSADID